MLRLVGLRHGSWDTFRFVGLPYVMACYVEADMACSVKVGQRTLR